MNTEFFRIFAILLCLLLTACNDSSSRTAPASTSTPEEPAGPEEPVVERVGASTDYSLPSNVDGANIAFTVHEPAAMLVPGSFPLVLHSHGYGGSRIDAANREATDDPVFKRLLEEGYGVVSIGQRGFGESGGKVRILDPYFEGQDLLQVLDWAEANLDWLAYDRGNLVLGAYGGSYGGGYQHLVYAIDPLHRMDAMVPEITWHDLRYSLYPNGVFKTYWAALLSIVGNLKAPSGGGQDMIVNEGLAQGLATNSLSEEQLALLYQNSMVSYCNGDNPYVLDRLGGAPLTPIDAMYWQGTADTLFNLNEQLLNVKCLLERGGDVRLLTKNQGHDSAGDGGEQCGDLRKAQATIDWFDEKLKGQDGQADYIPGVCYQLDGSKADAVVLPALPEPQVAVSFGPQSLIALEGSPQSVSVPLFTVGAEGAVLAGIPEITVNLVDPAGLNQGDPIVFATLMRRPAGQSEDVELNPNMVLPLRGFGSGLETELLGVANRLAPGDEVRLVLYASYSTRYPNAGAKVPVPVEISGDVRLPLYTSALEAPPEN